MSMESENTSGQGQNAFVPEEVKNRFNWGAFLLNWIWGIGNNTYITLVIFLSFIAAVIPFFGAFVPLALCIWFGVKGNEWAWQNKKFESVEAFHEYQKKWAIAGVIVVIAFFVLAVLATFLGVAALYSLGSSVK